MGFAVAAPGGARRREPKLAESRRNQPSVNVTHRPGGNTLFRGQVRTRRTRRGASAFATAAFGYVSVYQQESRGRECGNGGGSRHQGRRRRAAGAAYAVRRLSRVSPPAGAQGIHRHAQQLQTRNVGQKRLSPANVRGLVWRKFVLSLSRFVSFIFYAKIAFFSLHFERTYFRPRPC